MMLDTDPDTSVLALILDENPTLSWRGWWSRWHENNEPLGTLERVRRETLDAHGLGQFRRARAFLAVAPRRKSVNRGHSTYFWKHRVESWTRKTNDDRYANIYCGEGAFIAAAIASGLIVRRERNATFVNLSEHARLMGDWR